MRTIDRSLLFAFASLGLAVVLWGTSYWPTEVAGRHASPVTLAALRTFPAAGERIPVLGTTGLAVGFGGVALMVSSQLGGGDGDDITVTRLSSDSAPRRHRRRCSSSRWSPSWSRSSWAGARPASCWPGWP
jgi:hypothetical protein